MEGIFMQVVNNRMLRYTHIGIHKWWGIYIVETYWTYTQNAYINKKVTSRELYLEKTQVEKRIQRNALLYTNE